MRRRREGRALLELPGRRSEREGGEGVWKIAVGEGGESGTGKKRAKVPLLRGGGFGLILTWRRWWLKQRQSTSPPPPSLLFPASGEESVPPPPVGEWDLDMLSRITFPPRKRGGGGGGERVAPSVCWHGISWMGRRAVGGGGGSDDDGFAAFFLPALRVLCHVPCLNNAKRTIFF